MMGEEEISVIVNPTAAGGAVSHGGPISGLPEGPGPAVPEHSPKPRGATELALEAVRQGYHGGAVGGDGTLNEVVNGL